MAARTHRARTVQEMLLCRPIRPGPACCPEAMAGMMRIDWQNDHALCAWIDGQQVAMLDIGRQANNVTINMLFVKPPYRRRGIGRALLQQLLLCHPQAGLLCSDPRLRALLGKA